MTQLQRLQKKLAQSDVSSIIIESAVNREYVSGFTGTAGALLITEQDALFITDFRYVEQAEKQSPDFTIIKQERSMAEEIAEQVKKRGLQTVGFEKSHVTYAQFEQFDKYIEATLEPVSGLVESLRLYKTPAELSIIEEAAKIVDLTFDHITSFIQPGVKEVDVANELEFFMRKQGAACSSFDIIVASGERSAYPHGVASTKEIQKGELVTMDFGAYYKGYCSDMTRTVAVGEPAQELKKIYDTVHEAQEKAMQHLGPNMSGVEADAVARDHIKAAGFGEYFGHGLGHGLGMEVHEAPRLSPKGEQMLEPGMVVTVEPGIYVAGLGGTRIEDDAVITENGNKRLTHSTKELLIL
ncbi:M24 family metallopeptidase [Salsuginibacillus kocurii]|uniref:M24 family metallopeptidase n=1 Tax=Salsuginibacillus kocurii TaxID=427078 RepID=UPI000376BA1A|nr:Xaa-Pro peptidase family protein [Salsuginibacillus kocurii]